MFGPFIGQKFAPVHRRHGRGLAAAVPMNGVACSGPLEHKMFQERGRGRLFGEETDVATVNRVRCTFSLGAKERGGFCHLFFNGIHSDAFSSLSEIFFFHKKGKKVRKVAEIISVKFRRPCLAIPPVSILSLTSSWPSNRVDSINCLKN